MNCDKIILLKKNLKNNLKGSQFYIISYVKLSLIIKLYVYLVINVYYFHIIFSYKVRVTRK